MKQVIVIYHFFKKKEGNGDIMVLKALSNFFRRLDRRIKVLYTLIGVHMGHQQLSMQYNQIYATALGANPVELGTLNSISSVAASMMSIPSGWLADRYGAKVTLLIGLSLTAAVATIYSLADNWLMLIPAILLYGAGAGLILPYVDILLINYGKAENRGVIISLSRTLWSIPSTFTPLIAATIVDHFGGLTVESPAESIRPLYYIQIVFATLVCISIARWLTSPASNSIEKSMNKIESGGFIQDFRDIFKGEKWLGRYIILSTIRSIGMRIATAFVPLWMVNVKGADPYTLGFITAAGMITYMLLQIPMGRLSDRIGRKKTFFLLRPFYFLATLFLILAPNPRYLILVGILGGNVFGGSEGGIGGISSIPFITMQHELVPAEKRGRWHGILTLFGILSFPASILVGIMWQHGIMIEVLLLPVILEVLILFPILYTIPDTAHIRVR